MIGRPRLTLILVVFVVLQGCSDVQHRSKPRPPQAFRRTADALPERDDGFFRWLGVIEGTGEALVVPGLLPGFVREPLFVLNLQTRRSRRVENVSGITTAAVSRSRAEAALGVLFADGSPCLFTGVRLYSSASGRVGGIFAKDKGFLGGFVPSPSWNLVAGYIVPSDDLYRWANWQAKRLQKRRAGPRPVVRLSVYLVDMHARKGRAIPISGTPQCWTVDGHTLYCATPERIVAYNVASGAVKSVSLRRGLRYAQWSATLGGFVVVSEGRTECAIELVDQKFVTSRRIARCKSVSSPEMSPNGCRLAYRTDHEYYILDLRTGRSHRLGSYEGNLGPTFVSDSAVLLGSSTGDLYLVALDGRVKETYRIAGLGGGT